MENAGISSQQTLEVRSQSLPDSFAMLILAVMADLGPPVSYVKTSQSVNRMELIVNKKTRLGDYRLTTTTTSNSPVFFSIWIA